MEKNINNSTEYSLGQIVFLKANPNIKGPIVGLLEGPPENRVNVWIDGKSQTFYVSQIAPEVKSDEKQSLLSCNEFHAYLTALQIRSPVLSTLYSLNSARIEYIPYQYRPVLKFIKSERPRILIADSVGVGKTIEAGLILRELQARSEVNSVLIICPRPLVTEQKWQREMKRFDEDFAHLDGKTLRYCINEMHRDGVWPNRFNKVILPYSLLDKTLLFGPGGSRKRKAGKGLLDLDPPPHFDLVIVDEAHHIRNQGTANHDAVSFFCDNAEAAVFLTATPIQLGNQDLFTLLNVLRSDLIIDKESFEHMSEPNPFINQAVNAARAQNKDWRLHARNALDQAAATAWGQAILKNNPDFKYVRSSLSEGNVTHEDRIQLITDMEALHTFSGIINRTRRRDIGEFTIRRPQTVEVPQTPEQEQLHEALLETKAEIFRSLHGDQSVNFLMTTLRRQLASCLYGLGPFLENILNRNLDEFELTEADAIDAIPKSELVPQIHEKIETLLDKVKKIDAEDLKLEALRKIIHEREPLSNNKIMVFSSFRHTLAYLYKHLKSDGVRVGMIHGDVPDEERLNLRHRFEMHRSEDECLDLMLFSEVGCEGLDYQFCNCIVNYDLPWNPMKIEQRIGRIDRKGQKSESVTIINMITPDTVDADIYERCLLRIGIFENALGGNEEILGEITSELRHIAEDYELTQEERRSKLQQLTDNKILLLQEQDRLEAQQLEMFSIPLSEQGIEKEVNEATSYWLSPTSIQRLVTHYIQKKIGTDQEFILGEKSLKTLRLSQQARNRLLEDFERFPREITRIFRDWENWLKGTEQHLHITFDADGATKYPDATFIMPIHPLVKQAELVLNIPQDVVTYLKVQSNKVPVGQYEFAIYEWRLMGEKENLILKPITTSDALMPHLMNLLEKAEDNDATANKSLIKKEELESLHHTLWNKALKEHKKHIQEISEYRKESLSTSHQKRIALLEKKIKEVPEPNIQRMRRQQIANAESDYNRRIEELGKGAENADITAELVAYGILEVYNEL